MAGRGLEELRGATPEPGFASLDMSASPSRGTLHVGEGARQATRTAPSNAVGATNKRHEEGAGVRESTKQKHRMQKAHSKQARNRPLSSAIAPRRPPKGREGEDDGDGEDQGRQWSESFAAMCQRAPPLDARRREDERVLRSFEQGLETMGGANQAHLRALMRRHDRSGSGRISPERAKEGVRSFEAMGCASDWALARLFATAREPSGELNYEHLLATLNAPSPLGHRVIPSLREAAPWERYDGPLPQGQQGQEEARPFQSGEEGDADMGSRIEGKVRQLDSRLRIACRRKDAGKSGEVSASQFHAALKEVLGGTFPEWALERYAFAEAQQHDGKEAQPVVRYEEAIDRSCGSPLVIPKRRSAASASPRSDPVDREAAMVNARPALSRLHDAMWRAPTRTRRLFSRESAMRDGRLSSYQLRRAYSSAVPEADDVEVEALVGAYCSPLDGGTRVDFRKLLSEAAASEGASASMGVGFFAPTRPLSSAEFASASGRSRNESAGKATPGLVSMSERGSRPLTAFEPSTPGFASEEERFSRSSLRDAASSGSRGRSRMAGTRHTSSLQGSGVFVGLTDEDGENGSRILRKKTAEDEFLARNFVRQEGAHLYGNTASVFSSFAA